MRRRCRAGKLQAVCLPASSAPHFRAVPNRRDLAEARRVCDVGTQAKHCARQALPPRNRSALFLAQGSKTHFQLPSRKPLMRDARSSYQANVRIAARISTMIRTSRPFVSTRIDPLHFETTTKMDLRSSFAQAIRLPTLFHVTVVIAQAARSSFIFRTMTACAMTHIYLAAGNATPSRFK